MSKVVIPSAVEESRGASCPIAARLKTPPRVALCYDFDSAALGLE
jgi:hypothetical protein